MTAARARAVVAAATLALVAVLWIAAQRNADLLNPDGVAYIRIGEYFAAGNLSLAISGYWGPLLSWIIAALLRCGLAPMAAARAAMAVSALVFAGGCHAVLRGFPLKTWQLVLGTAVAGVASIFWSVEYITPDLLVAGLMLGAVSFCLRVPDRRSAFGAGLLFGLAFLAKAVALPFAVLALAAFSVLWYRRAAELRGRVWRFFFVSLVVVAVLVLPWAMVLSARYGRLVFSTTAGINHAVAGPPNVDREHPFVRTIHHPEAGRVTSWEDPSAMAYAFWSPLESREAFFYQLRLTMRNLWTFIGLLDHFGSALAIAALAAAALIGRSRREADHQVPVSWSLIPIVVLVALYAPLHIDPENFRFFYALLPFVYVLGMGGADRLVSAAGIRPSFRAGAYAIVALLYLWQPVDLALVALRGISNPASDAALTAARALRQAGIRGPVVGGATASNGLPGLYLAFMLDEPWYGDVRHPLVADYEQSGALLAVAPRWSDVARNLEQSPGVRDLDSIAFPRDRRSGMMIRLFLLRPK